VLVYHYSMGLDWLDAVYFTVTIMTTVGFGDISLRDTPSPVKIFGIVTMLAGALLLVMVLSAVAGYIVSRGLEQAMGLPRTALKEHFVVVGLGNIGHRVVTRLHEYGVDVLAIESGTDIRFSNILPREIPLLYGDGTDPRVLQSAGVERARALVAVTDSDMANLRAAHEAREMNPTIRTVVRVFSERLAEQLGAQTLGIDVALNPSISAGATFAACALADGVLAGISMGERLLVIRKAFAQLASDQTIEAHRLRESQGMLVLFRVTPDSSGVEVVREADLIRDGDELIVMEEYRAGVRGAPGCYWSEPSKPEMVGASQVAV